MSRYNFSIEAYFTKNHFLEILAQEQELFEVDGKKIMLKSLEQKSIRDSIGIKVESEMFENLNHCIKIAKKVYSNLLLRLNISHISYILDKFSKGNFNKYYKEPDAIVYKEIIITDILNKDNDLDFHLENRGLGCSHFEFDKLWNVTLNSAIKNSLVINNYRKYLWDKELNSKIDNTLVSASIEMLLVEENRPKEEMAVIQELIDYLDNKYKETKLIEYKNIKDMIESNKHKSIRKRTSELIKKYSNQENEKENLKLINIISENRTKEIHNGKNEINKDIWCEQLLFDIQYGYMKDLYINETK